VKPEPDIPEPDFQEPDLQEPDLSKPDLQEPDLPESLRLSRPETSDKGHSGLKDEAADSVRNSKANSNSCFIKLFLSMEQSQLFQISKGQLHVHRSQLSASFYPRQNSCCR
jgi:hypothetical protein